MSASLFVIMAVGQTYIIITAGIDLSVGSVLVLSSVVGVLVMRTMGGIDGGWTAAIAGIVVGMGGGLTVGLVNGFLIAKTHIPALIVTLGTLGIALGAGSCWPKASISLRFRQSIRNRSGSGRFSACRSSSSSPSP